MNNQQDILFVAEEVKKLYYSYLLPHLNLKINEHASFLKEFSELLKIYKRRYQSNLRPEGIFINELKCSFHKRSYEFIYNKYESTKKQNFDQACAEFTGAIISYLNNLDESVTKVQDEERFIVNEKDKFTIKFIKRIKNISYNLSQFPVKSGNLFRKLFRKPIKEKKQWHHTVPLRNLTAYYLKDALCLNLLPDLEEINRKKSAAYLQAWKSDEMLSLLQENSEKEINFDLRIDQLEKSYNNFVESFEKIFNETVSSCKDAFSKSGTAELPSSKFSSKKIQKKHNELNEEYESLYNGWSNTFFSLFEDWRLNKELYTLSERLKFEFNNLSVAANDKISCNILPNLVRLTEFLEEVLHRIYDFSGSSTEVKSLLYRERYRIKNKLTNLIPKTSDIILSQNIPDLVDRMEYFVKDGVKELPVKRAIVKTTSYTEKIKDSEIDYISPNEIITYSTLPSYIRTSSTIKSSIIQVLDEIQKGLKDIDRIADFNIETALSMFKSENNSFEDPLDIAVEGINRAIEKEKAVNEKLLGIESKINKEIGAALEKVNSELVNLTKNENVIEIKLKIAQKKTLHRTEELKQKLSHFVKNFFSIINSEISNIYIYIKNYVVGVRQKLGFESHHVSISSEISDFLAATENAVSRLPFVYQRLFRIEPLEDERFFVGREKELLLLNNAYENWKLKKYAPAIIYGEKGSGATTFLNFYLRSINSKYNIIRTTVERNIYTESDFVDLLKKILKKGNINNINNAAEYLNGLVTRQIVIVENLQNLFLKKVNGFIPLKMFFELVSLTNQNVFWIITSSLYAWNYLSKIINVSDYFGYLVQLDLLNDEQMIEIILKRHSISGYNISFETHANESLKRRYRKLSEAEIQDLLKKEYFSQLNKFARSNISLALLYWMRSTKEVTTNTIKLDSVVQLDFSFLNTMSPEKLFILHLLLLHDGLREEDVVEIYNKPVEEIKLRLLVLYDDGIIIKKEDLYLINPLLYRQVVQLLQSRNILH